MKCERGHLLPMASTYHFLSALPSPVVRAAPTLDQPSFISFLHHTYTPGMSRTRPKLPSLQFPYTLHLFHCLFAPKDRFQGLLLLKDSLLLYLHYLF